MNTSILLWLVGGIAIGWLAEYLLDLRFWRQTNKRLITDYANLEQRLESGSADVGTLKIQADSATATLAEREKEIKNLKILSRLLSAQLKQAHSERDTAVEQAKRMHAELAQYKHDFEKTELFEPTIVEFKSDASLSERLNVAGVKSFDALAELSDKDLYRIVRSDQAKLAKGQGNWRPATA